MFILDSDFVRLIVFPIAAFICSLTCIRKNLSAAKTLISLCFVSYLCLIASRLLFPIALAPLPSNEPGHGLTLGSLLATRAQAVLDQSPLDQSSMATILRQYLARATAFVPFGLLLTLQFRRLTSSRIAQISLAFPSLLIVLQVGICLYADMHLQSPKLEDLPLAFAGAMIGHAFSIGILRVRALVKAKTAPVV